MDTTRSSINLWTEWKVGSDNIRLRTPSPTPNVPASFYNEGLPFYANYNYEYGISTSYYSTHRDYTSISYFLIQAAILKYNNKELENNEMRESIARNHLNWMVFWYGNEQLRKETKATSEAIDYAVTTIFGDNVDLTSYLEGVGSIKKWWYSDEIESLKGKEKSKRKVEARSQVNIIGIREDIKEVSDEYRQVNYNILPTISHIEPGVPYTRPTIKKHGNGLYTSIPENRVGIMRSLREMNPNYTQKDIAEVMGLSLRMVKEYWNK